MKEIKKVVVLKGWRISFKGWTGLLLYINIYTEAKA
jgi:hypothetical protein